MSRAIVDPAREIADPEKARQFIVEEEWAPPIYRQNLVSDLTDEEAVTTAQVILESAIQRALFEKNLISSDH